MVPGLSSHALTRRVLSLARAAVYLASALLPALSLGPLIGWLLGGHPVALRWALAAGAVALVVVPFAGALALSHLAPGDPWRAWILATGGLATPYWWLTRTPPGRQPPPTTPPQRSLPPLPPVPPLPAASEWLAPTVLVFRGRRGASPPASAPPPAAAPAPTGPHGAARADQEPEAPALLIEDGRR